jgi:glycosyltransferase involved in cell wall biosynthesis
VASSSVKIITIIPAFNEERSISKVVAQLHQLYPEMTILVVNDGSTDSTALQAEQAGAKVITLPYNLGIGGAVQTGYLYAHYNEYDIAIQVDADGQHKPSEIPKILQPIFNGEADLVVGSRFVETSSYRSALSRRVGIAILSSIVRILTFQKINDVTSGFRAANKNCINLFSKDYSTDYPEVDSLVLTKKHNFQIQEVPVKMEPRMYGRSSITAMKSGYYMFKVSLTLLMRALKMNRRSSLDPY